MCLRSPDSLLRTRLTCRPAELDNHLGIGDKTLAEFIISLAEGQATPFAFHTCLAANGADLPLDFCGTLLTVIQRLRPAKAGAKAASGGGGPSRPVVKYPALAVPDSRQRAEALSRELLGGRDPLANATCVAHSSSALVHLRGAAERACAVYPFPSDAQPAAHSRSDDPRFMDERLREREERRVCALGCMAGQP